MKYLLTFGFIIVGIVTHAQSDNDQSQDTVSNWHFTGSIDTYYRHSSTKESSPTFLILEHNKLGLGSVNTSAAFNHSWIGGKVHIAAGPRAQQFYAFDDKGVLGNIREAFIYIKPINNLTINAGTMIAYPGYENDEPHLNLNYSASYVNSLTPATYTGVSAAYDLSENWTYTFGLFNDVDRKFDLAKGKSLASMLSFTNDYLAITGSVFQGKELDGSLSILDIFADFTISDQHKIGLEVYRTNFNNYNSFNATTAGGVNVYFIHPFNEYISLNMRGEYFITNAGPLIVPNFNRITGITTTLKFMKHGFTIFPEIRYDIARFAYFQTISGGLSKRDLSMIIGLSWSFGE